MPGSKIDDTKGASWPEAAQAGGLRAVLKASGTHEGVNSGQRSPQGRNTHFNDLRHAAWSSPCGRRDVTGGLAQTPRRGGDMAGEKNILIYIHIYTHAGCGAVEQMPPGDGR